MRQMFRARLNKFDKSEPFEKTEPAWSDIALFASYVIIVAMVALLLIAGLGYYVLR